MKTDHMWDMRTVYAVGRLYTEGGIAGEYADNPRALAAFKGELADKLKQEAQALAVDIDTADVQYSHPHLDMMTQTYRIRARWEPQTTEVELSCAGPHDGRVTAVSSIHHELRLPIVAAGSLLDGEDQVGRGIHYQTLRLAGWRESTRRWVFREVL